MKILVTGSRDLHDLLHVTDTLNSVHLGEGGPVTFVVHGDAKGSDQLAEQWAKSNQIPTFKHPADWDTHGIRAGSIRDAHMLALHDDVELVVAFPRGVSKGTKDIMRKARNNHITVLEA
jgi:hypothetical protein